jgi:hypothetical protein
MLQFINPEPASPDHIVPSQSKTATRGFRLRTAAWNSDVVRVGTLAVGMESVRLKGALTWGRTLLFRGPTGPHVRDFAAEKAGTISILPQQHSRRLRASMKIL